MNSDNDKQNTAQGKNTIDYHTHYHCYGVAVVSDNLQDLMVAVGDVDVVG